MRKTLLLTVAALLCLSVDGWAQSCDGCGIGYKSASLPISGGTLTGRLFLPDGAAGLPSIAFANDTDLGFYRITNNYMGLYALPSIFVFAPNSFYPGTDDAQDLGLMLPGYAWRHLQLNRSIQGSKSKTLADNTKTTFVDVDIAAGSYAGGKVIYTLYCADASDRVSRTGELPFSGQNTGGTETCAVGTATSSGDATNNAKAFTTVTFTCADGGTNQIQLEVLADCTIAAPTTLTIEYRLDMPKLNTVTPAT